MAGGKKCGDDHGARSVGSPTKKLSMVRVLWPWNKTTGIRSIFLCSLVLISFMDDMVCWYFTRLCS